MKSARNLWMPRVLLKPIIWRNKLLCQEHDTVKKPKPKKQWVFHALYLSKPSQEVSCIARPQFFEKIGKAFQIAAIRI